MIDKNERFSGIGAHVDIVCKTCKYKNTSRFGNPHYSQADCRFYPIDKPDDIYFDGKPCRYYVKEDSSENKN